MVDLDFDLDLRRRQFHTGVQRNIIALCVVIWRVRGIVRIRTEERGTVHFRLREQAPLRRLDFAKGILAGGSLDRDKRSGSYSSSFRTTAMMPASARSTPSAAC